MNYALNTTKERKTGFIKAMRAFVPLLVSQKKRLVFAFIAIILNSALNLAAPLFIGYAIDHYFSSKDFHGVLATGLILLGMYVGVLVTSYLQTQLMGIVGQRVLFTVRNTLFTKIESLPIAFFNQNKAGDLISRINNDTDKLNIFFSQSLVQFVASVFVMLGAGIFLISIDLKLGLIALVPAVVVLVFTQLVSPWIKRTNTKSLKSTGGLSAEIQESIENFKVIVAFNRRDYFRTRFDQVNKTNYDTAVKAGIANTVFQPVYGLASNISQLLVLVFGISMILSGNLTIGLLVSFLSYSMNFYNPLRQLAALWANFQVAMAGWDRISDILELETELTVVPSDAKENLNAPVLEFKNVDFSYPEGTSVLRDVSFSLERGKIYALVGPTGGGKTTTASLMARLYDPTEGTVLLHGKDIQSYTPEERTEKIGFILQEPFLFAGTVLENIIYGNTKYQECSSDAMTQVIEERGLQDLIARFDNGLETKIQTVGESMSLGQKQLIAFMRAVLRNPDLLILDEATANIDTVTESMLQNVLNKLPKETTLVVIAHRLHTIENADEIFFVNGGEITSAGSMEHAVEMLMQGKRKS